MTREPFGKDIAALPDVDPNDVPAGFDRRTFIMPGPAIGAASVISGCTPSKEEVKVGPGLSSSHTIGPMRIT